MNFKQAMLVLGLVCAPFAVPLVSQSLPPGQLAAQHKALTLTNAPLDKSKGACVKTTGGTPPVDTYTFSKTWFPIWRQGCADDSGAPMLAYFAVDKSGVFGHQIQYLYNAKQSTNQINADLLTGTFPGFQVVLAATATAGSSQAANPTGTGTTTASFIGFNPFDTSTSASSTSQTDSVQTAVSKLEQGGDFNVRFPAPVARKVGSVGGLDVKLVPNLGFMVNGLTAQNTVTESTEYALNVPLEAYFELGSYEQDSGVSRVVLYGDFKPGAELISPGLKQAIGLTSNRYFFLGQASVGAEFSNGVRIGVQYFLGPSQLYATANSTGTGAIPTTDHVGGFHLVVSYSKPSGS